MRCARHPNEETGLSCSKCGTPICPKCSVVTPVGHKCPACAKPDRTVVDVPFPLALRCFVITALVATGAGIALHFIPIFPLFGYLFFGWVVGDISYNNAGRRVGPTVEIITGFSALLGLLLSRLIVSGPELDWSFVFPLYNPFALIGIIIAVTVAVSRIRYR